MPDFCHQPAISMLLRGFVGTAPINTVPEGRWRGAFVIIFDCNGVLVDSEQIAAAVAADEFTRVGVPITPELVMRYFFGRRPADMFAAIEAATKRRLPVNFAARVTAATLVRLRAELRAVPHAAHALHGCAGRNASLHPRRSIASG
jgi:beta-phosphoglucomutase-like phosphatase (HAD superfamily)